MFLIKTQGFSDKSTALKRGSALKMFSFQSGSLRTVPKFHNHQTDTFLNKKTMYHAQNTQTDKTTDCGYLGTGSRNILLPVVPMTLSRERNGIFEGKEWHLRGKGMAL